MQDDFIRADALVACDGLKVQRVQLINAISVQMWQGGYRGMLFFTESQCLELEQKLKAIREAKP